jgi:hypothetical protein
LHDANRGASEQYIVLNTKNEIARWVLRINVACRERLPFIEIDQVKRLNGLLKWATWYHYPSSEYLTGLREFLPRWKDIPGLLPELCPPPNQLTSRMFELSRNPFS